MENLFKLRSSIFLLSILFFSPRSGRRVFNERLNERFVARQNKLKQIFGTKEPKLYEPSFAYLLLEGERSEVGTNIFSIFYSSLYLFR